MNLTGGRDYWIKENSGDLLDSLHQDKMRETLALFSGLITSETPFLMVEFRCPWKTQDKK